MHTVVQGKLLESAGAMAVGIVSALRSAVVSVASGLLFCGPASPHQCLTPYSAAGAGLVTGGVLLYTLASEPWAVGHGPSGLDGMATCVCMRIQHQKGNSDGGWGEEDDIYACRGASRRGAPRNSRAWLVTTGSAASWAHKSPCRYVSRAWV